jgi:hypothetical protein
VAAIGAHSAWVFGSPEDCDSNFKQPSVIPFQNSHGAPGDRLREAIHWCCNQKAGLLRRCAPRNDESSRDTSPHSRGAVRPKLCKNVVPRKQREQGKPGARCTRSLVCIGSVAHEYSPQVHRNTRPSLRNGFNGLLRALLGDRAFLPPSSSGYGASRPGWADASPQDLTPASGRQDHTTSPSAANISRQHAVLSLTGKPALRSRRAPNAAASTASRAQRP